MADARNPRILRMIQDPELGGYLLLVGMFLAAKLDFGLSIEGPSTLRAAADALWPGFPPYLRGRRILDTLRDDIRRYRPPQLGEDEGCGAPMVRREGECGKNTTMRVYVTDWDTGEMRWLLACSRHHEWFETTHRANRESAPADPPRPYANSGGVLAKHFPEYNWPEFWKRLDRKWMPHPEGTPWPKPKLRLFVGEDLAADTAPTERPLLAVITSP